MNEAIGNIQLQGIKISPKTPVSNGSGINKNRAKLSVIQSRKISDAEKAEKNQEKMDKESVDRITRALEEYITLNRRELKIRVHEGTGNLIVKVISAKDGKVIRELPPEDLLDLAAKIEKMTGAIFNENA
jgi:flagellar protein FlaG